MTYDPTAAHAAAQKFFQTTRTLKRLGLGVSGTVYLSPDLRTAAKIHHQHESFETEVSVYHLLKQRRIFSLNGLTIPKLICAVTAERIIQMDFVSAPYLLDFAGVLFEDPEYPEEVKAHWYAEVEQRFGVNTHLAFDVYNTFLAQLGLYYMDLRPSNLKLEGLADFQPHVPESKEDWW